ncbi:unnamed protein product, partial [Medioppia subpectinata]
MLSTYVGYYPPGTYVGYYPPGYYDNVYTGDKVMDRRSDEEEEEDVSHTYVDPNSTYSNEYRDIVDHLSTDNNNSYTHNDLDEDGLIKKSFGYRVTVYRSPQSGDSNVTEEVLNDGNDLLSDEMTASESNDDYTVTTDANGGDGGDDQMITSESNQLKSESQTGLKGSAKGMDYKRNQYNRDRGSNSREELNTKKNKKVDTHDRRANNERALKERTIIEFFEREQILDSAYNKDKLNDPVDGQHNHNTDDHHTSGSMTSAVSGSPDGSSVTPTGGTLDAKGAHEYTD